MKILLELLFSFTAAIGFGIVFGIRPKELGWAGLACVVASIAIIIAKRFTDNALLYTFCGALTGAFFAEFVGHWKHTAIAKFMYPALVPMIPGDTFYYFIYHIIQVDGTQTLYYGTRLISVLCGIALGTMVAPLLVRTFLPPAHR